MIILMVFLIINMLKIRPFEWKDAESIHYIHKDREMASLVGDEPAKNLENTIHVLSDMINSNAILLIAELDGKTAGFFNINTKKGTQAHCGSVGVVIDKKFWGRGIGKRIVEEGIKLAKKRKLKKLTYHTVEYNKRSINLAKELGFRLAGKLKKQIFMDKKYYDLLIFEKLL
jgi:RimJ/RimL family protein N-acetyltransferase